MQRVFAGVGARRALHSSLRRYSEFSHVVIGGGVVGAAIGAELQSVTGNSVLLLEQHGELAQETTSRNSEVIHAGLYYPENSLKGRLCIEGKNKLYREWEKGNLPVGLKRCGKWVVAQDESEAEYLEKLSANARLHQVEVEFVSPSKARETLPNIQAKYGALESPSTGIISAHDLTLFYQGRFENTGGTVGLNSQVRNIQYNQGTPNYSLEILDGTSGETFEITADNVVNSAGLHAQKVSNLLLPVERHFKSYFAKGTYFTFQSDKPISTSKITDKLIYPCPNPNASSLGTHLTFDLGGQLKFGPDLEWLDIDDASEIDYSPSTHNLEAATKAVSTYFPLVKQGSLIPSYSGVRPKLLSAADNKKQFADFIIREEEGFPGFVNLVGIESPGLTSSWAIGEYVRNIYHK